MLLAQDAAPPLERWGDFYVIVGTAGATLTGLVFIVVTLITRSGRSGQPETMGAFATPNVVHFCATLLVTATLAAPWRDLAPAGAALGVYGAVGVAYGARTAWRASRQTGYRPVLEDWLFHVVLPTAAYAMLAAAGVALRRGAEWAPFGAAAVVLALLVVGVHNAWDSMTYIATEQMNRAGGAAQDDRAGDDGAGDDGVADARGDAPVEPGRGAPAKR